MVLPNYLLKNMTRGGAERGKSHFGHQGLNQILRDQFGENTLDDNDYCTSAGQKMTEHKYSNG